MIIIKDITEDGEYILQISGDGVPRCTVAVCKDTYELDLVGAAIRCTLEVMNVKNRVINNL